MSGDIGSVVTLHTPVASFCIGKLLPPTDTATLVALGMRSRNVTRRSAPTSGDFTGAAPRPPRAGAALGAPGAGAAGVGACACRALMNEVAANVAARVK